MNAALGLFILSSAFVLLVAGNQDENCVTYFEGCTISKGECLCGESKGCTNPYPYDNKEQCEKDIKGQFDPCGTNPCKNGLCVQVKREGKRTYKCVCDATGFYGSRCQHRCDESKAGQEDYPQECVDII